MYVYEKKSYRIALIKGLDNIYYFMLFINLQTLLCYFDYLLGFP